MRLIKKEFAKEKTLYDLEVTDNNNFIANNAVVHNSHKIGAEQFLKAFTRFNTRYALGLSATPDREDGLEKIYYLHTSEHLIMHKPVRKLDADYFIIQYTRKKPFKRGKRFTPFRITLINNIIEDERRNEMLYQWIVDMVAIGRKPLFVSERIAHLELFFERTKKEFPKLNVLKFYGSVNPPKEEKLNADIVIATIKKIYDGEDIPQLDTLINGTPYGSKTICIQLKGRIERMFKNKKHPVIIDTVDNGVSFGMFQGLARKRHTLYNELGLKNIKKII